MAFVHSITRWLRTLNGPDITVFSLGQSGNTLVTVPATGTFWPGNPRAGYVRIKQNTLGTNGTTKIGSIQATDGTNVANIYSGDTNASANNQYIDSSFMFVYDWGVSNINVNIVTANAASTYDIEVVGVR
jgi:hypothetical protein